MTPLIQQIETIVEAACAAESNVFGYNIWTHHITLVAKNGRMLAAQFGADPEIVEIAALLHDYASVKDEALVKDHHLHGPVETERILTELGYPPGRIEQVKHCIATHRGSVPVARRSAEADCLANADAMAHLQQIPSLMHLAFTRFDMDADEGTRWVRSKLERTWQKMNPQVREMMRDKYEAAMKTLTVDDASNRKPSASK